MLTVRHLDAHYGKSRALSDISLDLAEGEIVGLLGRNGAGKTTLLRSLVGLVQRQVGSLTLDGVDISGWSVDRLSRAGIVLVPDYRGVIGALTVEQNLQIAERRGSSFSLHDAYVLFPRLKQRRASSGAALSGGEQQMLAIARGMMCGPRVLLLDEPTEGLAPVIIQEIVDALTKLQMEGHRLSIVIVDQNIDVCLNLAGRQYILELGRIVYEGTSAELAADHDIQQRFLGVDHGSGH
ncbi:ABC transporter ATP-binding protein [Bradyrhizobium sp.]|uniref:ABC transporter ATP-binding protein n=1 Tax=Bradyrhizobium sp. TaxID=376 RepID=UPI0039E42744